MRNSDGLRWVGALLACLGLLTAGCESDGSLGDGHDFGDNDPAVIVALGDSITVGSSGAGASYPELLSGMIGKTVINAGSSGEHSVGGRSRVRSVLLGQRPGFLLILYGANDAIHGRGSDTVAENLRAMVQAARDNQTIPVLATLTPAYASHAFMVGRIDSINERIRLLGAEENVVVVDLFDAFGTDESLMLDDGLHPNEAGNQVIASSFAGLF